MASLLVARHASGDGYVAGRPVFVRPDADVSSLYGSRVSNSATRTSGGSQTRDTGVMALGMQHVCEPLQPTLVQDRSSPGM
jgi:hypothetical protein